MYCRFIIIEKSEITLYLHQKFQIQGYHKTTGCQDVGYFRNGTVRRRRFGDGRFGDEMWNAFFFGMSPKCKSSHCRCEACRPKIRSSTWPNRTAMRTVDLNLHTLIKSMLTTSCTIASVECAVYQDGGVINILAKSLRRRTIELQLLWLFCIVM